MTKWEKNEVSKGIFKAKYAKDNTETPEQFVKRVSSIVSKDIRKDIERMLSDGTFCFGGRTLFMAGRDDVRASSSNCYCLKSPEDNIEDIYDTVTKMARIFSLGGGAGLNISKLRPRGAKVHNSAITSSGAVSFLPIIDSAGEVIGQQGRRAAIMVGLNCSHPDIEEFLKIKQDGNKLSSMNISILFTSEFMNAVENNLPYVLKFDVEATGEHIEKVIDAKKFYEEFCKTQWDWGDPGSIFIDRVRDWNLLSNYNDYHIEISNPCVTGDTLILTKEGYKRIDSLLESPVTIWNGYQWSTVQPRVTGHNQHTYKIKFYNGGTLQCTDYHKFILKDGNRVEAKDLHVGDKLIRWTTPDTNMKITDHVTSIEDAGIVDTVYCFNEPLNHSGIFNGIITAQCSEFFGNAWSACNLGSLNLYSFIKDKFTDKAHLDDKSFKDAVHTAIMALNDVLDYGYDKQPFDENRKCIDDWRQIGLGMFGIADALIAMKLRYGSPESIKFISYVFDILQSESIIESAYLAKQNGSFGKYDYEKTASSAMFKSLPEKVQETVKENGLRNGTILSIAPNGSISMFMGNYSGGVEPLYALSYERTSHKLEDSGKSFKVFSHSIQDLLERDNMPLDTPDDIIKKKYDWVIESHDVPPSDRVCMQSAIQMYVDNAISSTVNLPNSATPKDIYDIYMSAWKNGCKGITVFRDGCKRGNILGTNENLTEEEKRHIAYDTIEPETRSKIHKLRGETVLEKSPDGEKMYITVNVTDDGHLFEIFTNAAGKNKDDIATITRLTSLALRSGIKVDEVVNQLCSDTDIAYSERFETVGDAIADVLLDVYDDMKQQQKGKVGKNTKIIIDKPANKAIATKCPQCGKETLRPDGHCVTCTNCGWSACQL